METTKCPNCGASFQFDGVNNICPYCGSAIKSATPKSTPKKGNEEALTVLPFVLSEDDAISVIIKELVVTNGVPLDIFERLSNITVEKYRLPMYGSLINLDVCWSAQSVVRKSRKYRDKNGNEKTEYYDEYYPISGNAFGRCDTLFLANKCAEIPGKLRDYAERLPYEYSKYANSELLDTKMGGDCKEIQADLRFEELRVRPIPYVGYSGYQCHIKIGMVQHKIVIISREIYAMADSAVSKYAAQPDGCHIVITFQAGVHS